MNTTKKNSRRIKAHGILQMNGWARRANKYILIFLVFVITLPASAQSNIISYTCDAHKQDVRMYWRDDSNTIISSPGALINFLNKQNKTVVLAMNGGMYQQDQSPQGLYIENGKVIKKASMLTRGYGNFYMQPNGIFYLGKNKTAGVCATQEFSKLKDIAYATQSGPMLVHNDKMNPHFIKGSKNLNIRNGVGILPDGRIVFAISKEEVNFYDFATFFLKQGCENALYLDGFVSRAYIPSKHFIQKDGHFGVMIAVTE